MADANVSKNGVWVDGKTGKVVESQPEEGFQIVPAGAEITPDMQKAVDAAKDAAAGDTDTKTAAKRS